MDDMTIEEMRNHEWVVSWSGGKDSTATIIKMHEHNVPIKKIIYVRMMYNDELPATLPIMTNFVDDAIKVFESWGYIVEIVKSIRTMEELANRRYKRSKAVHRNGKYYGITACFRGFCNLAAMKMATLKSLTSENDFEMIGYACDETDRLHRLTDKKQSILLELGITEEETYDICRGYNLLSPLYEIGLPRDGCWFCPNANKKARKMMREEYPELVQKITNLIEMCDYDISMYKCRSRWLEDYYKEREVSDTEQDWRSDKQLEGQMNIFEYLTESEE